MAKRLIMEVPGAIWQYRHFIRAAIVGEFKGRFARSRLGLIWTILHPLAQAVIFAIVLSEVMGAKLPGISSTTAYPIYLLAGLSAWSLFSEVLNRCLNIFVEYASTLKKISFPRLCLPIIVGGSALLNHALLLVAILVVSVCFGHMPGIAWLSIPLGILAVTAFAFGLGVLLGVFNVFARDIGHVMSVVLQLWFWITPIVYPLEIVPERILWLVQLNPLVPIVKIYQDALLHNQFPDFSTLVLPFTVGFGLIVTAFVVFRRASPEMVDVL